MIGRILTGFLALALFGGGANAQNINGSMFGQNSAEADGHKIGIYVETLRAIQDGPGTFEDKRAQINANLFYTGMCSIEREMLFGITKENSLAGDAAQLRSHYGYLTQAMERIGLVSAAQAQAEFAAGRAQAETFLKQLYTSGSEGSDPETKTAMLGFSDTCRQVTLAARNVDAMALERQGR